MAIILCRECKKEISDTASSCPHCGAVAHKPAKTGLLLLLLAPVGLLVVFLGFGAIKANTPEGKEKSKLRTAIELCWSEAKKQSNTPSQARFVAGACEQMEADFKAKFRVDP